MTLKYNEKLSFRILMRDKDHCMSLESSYLFVKDVCPGLQQLTMKRAITASQPRVWQNAAPQWCGSFRREAPQASPFLGDSRERNGCYLVVIGLLSYSANKPFGHLGEATETSSVTARALSLR